MGMQQKSELPEGWAWTNIGQIIESMKNGIYKPSKFYIDDGIACLRMYNIDQGKIIWKDIKRMDLTQKEINDYLLEPGDLLVNRVNSRELVGKAAVIPNGMEKCVFESKNIRVKVNKKVINPYYLSYYFTSHGSEYFNQNSQQVVGMASISQPQIAEFPILLPPFPEQHRIVSAIEALFARLDATNEKLDRVPEILKKFRESVLAAACDGRLTEDWREATSDLKDKNEIIKTEPSLKTRYNNEDEKFQVNSMIPNSWKYVTFTSIIENFDGKRIPLKSEDRKKRQGDYPYYGASGIIDYIDDYIFDGKFLLISEDGANLLARNTPIAFIAKGQFWVNNHAHIVQTRFNIPLEYLKIFFNGFDLQYYITGSAQPKLTQSNLNKIQIPLPPLPEQQEIVRRINALFTFAYSIEAKVAAARDKTEKLRQSILAKAFSGQLVETEAEIAKREGRDYEAAEVLLDKIKAEKGNKEKKR
jgi:type I restriction enzyme S subunit